MHLEIALSSNATLTHPLLMSYSLQIPTNVFTNLLFISHVKRLKLFTDMVLINAWPRLCHCKDATNPSPNGQRCSGIGCHDNEMLSASRYPQMDIIIFARDASPITIHGKKGKENLTVLRKDFSLYVDTKKDEKEEEEEAVKEEKGKKKRLPTYFSFPHVSLDRVVTWVFGLIRFVFHLPLSEKGCIYYSFFCVKMVWQYNYISDFLFTVVILQHSAMLFSLLRNNVQSGQ